MHAGIVHEVNGTPRWEEFPEPKGSTAEPLIEVSTAAIGPSELMRVSNWGASYYGPFKGPKVMGGEGIGRLEDGTRIYFGHSTAPYGAVAHRTIVAHEEIWPIPDALTDDQILPLAITGTGALIPMEEARIQRGERVLILGATGPLGQIALQLARIMGAGEVVAAARREESLRRVVERGFADRFIRLGEGRDEAVLKDGSNGGFHFVLDCVYGDTMVAALKATARGGRVLSISNVGGRIASVDLRDLIFRTHSGVATGIRPAAERRAAFERLLGYAMDGSLKPVDTVGYRFAEIAQAWAVQSNGPNAKILLRP
jgi:NADPH:quinone reductase-like Zn-dependent oxidoreductase